MFAHISSRAAGLGLTVTLALSGCSLFTMSNNTASQSREPDAYAGPLTLINESSQPVCGVDLYFNTSADDDNENLLFASDPVAPGQSREFAVAGRVYGVRLLGCSGDVVWDTYEPRNARRSQAVTFTTDGTMRLVDSGTLSLTSPVTLVAETFPLRNYLPAPGPMANTVSAATLLQVANDHARARSFAETFDAVIVTSTDWDIVRNQYGTVTGRRVYAEAGAHWPDGNCTIQAIGFSQAHDGASFSNTFQFYGFGDQHQVPCAAVDLMAGRSSAAGSRSTPAATRSASPAPTGGLCSNTCGTSNDGECDDGGPNSLYAICTLGTDCGDCGPR